MAAVTGKRFNSIPAVLDGYRCLRIKDADYPGVVPEIGAKTAGKVISGVTDRDFDLLDRFEGELYRRQSETVVTAAGATLKTWVYVIEKRFRDRISGSPWSLENFLATGYHRFMREFVDRPWNPT